MPDESAIPVPRPRRVELATGELTRRVSVSSLITAVILIVGVLLLPQVAPSYVIYVVSLVMVNIVAVTGLSIVMGYAGLVSLGHAGFTAIGAYVTTLLMIHFGLSYWVSLLLASLLAMGAGFVVGLPALRVGAVYLAMTTFAFGEAIFVILVNWIEVTGGANGVHVPAPTFFGQELSATGIYYALAVALLLLSLLAYRIVTSPVGRAFVALREGELAAQAIGIQPSIFKTLAFAVSAFFGGLSGGLFAAVVGFINPDSFTFGATLLYLNMAVVGGMGTLLGPIVGSAIMTVLPELGRGLGQYRGVYSGVILLLFLIFMPNGIVGAVKRRLNTRRQESLTVLAKRSE